MPVALTHLHTRIIEYLMARPGRVVTRGELIRECWGYNPESMTTRRVDSTMGRIRQLLAPRGITVTTHKGFGYSIGQPGDPPRCAHCGQTIPEATNA